MSKMQDDALEKYKGFFEDMFDKWANHYMDFETGVDFQELGLKYGLMEEVKYNPEVHGYVEDAEPGDPIYIKAALSSSAREEV